MNTRLPPAIFSAVGTAQPGFAASRPGYFVTGAGAPVVMLHSSLGSKSQWTVLAERLSRRFRVIALDLCGYGDNKAITAGASFTLDDEVRLITARLDQLVERHVRVHVVGHSYGGLAALRFAQRMRGRAASLTLYDPVVFRALDNEEPALVAVRKLADQVAALVAAGQRHDAARAFVDFWGGEGSFAALPPPAQDGIARRVDKVPLDFQAAMGWPLNPIELRTIAVPTLLLAGNRSPVVVQRIATRLTQMLSNCRVGWFDAGHMAPITDAHRINPWIEAFLDVCSQRETSATRRPASALRDGLELFIGGHADKPTRDPVRSARGMGWQS